MIATAFGVRWLQHRFSCAGRSWLTRALSARSRFAGVSPLILTTLAILLVAIPSTRAHGPYDSSTQLTIRDDALELNATLGLDGAKQILLNAGMSEADAVNALATHGPSTLTDLSAETSFAR